MMRLLRFSRCRFRLSRGRSRRLTLRSHSSVICRRSNRRVLLLYWSLFFRTRNGISRLLLLLSLTFLCFFLFLHLQYPGRQSYLLVTASTISMPSNEIVILCGIETVTFSYARMMQLNDHEFSRRAPFRGVFLQTRSYKFAESLPAFPYTRVSIGILFILRKSWSRVFDYLLHEVQIHPRNSVWIAADHTLQQRQTQAPDVAVEGVLLSLDSLWGHVRTCANESFCYAHCLRHFARDSKVCELRLSSDA
mmetsp:Transcript_6217/g.12338  ORF Transcript_6217/g.12338 Transcript_6217/m.12338 type:complete len:249 (+) Transcript_6217:85-831(+)